MDKILGLGSGADDYITKPFLPTELIARVRSQLRRYMELGGNTPKKNDHIEIGSISLDDTEKIVTVDGAPVSLTPTEYEILKLFMQNPGMLFSPKEIYRRIWKDDPYGAEGTVAVHIRHLREKIELNPAEPRYLKAIWGQGYKIEKQPK
jgi:DNA-binding response OmpR family regulator